MNHYLTRNNEAKELILPERYILFRPTYYYAFLIVRYFWEKKVGGGGESNRKWDRGYKTRSSLIAESPMRAAKQNEYPN